VEVVEGGRSVRWMILEDLSARAAVETNSAAFMGCTLGVLDTLGTWIRERRNYSTKGSQWTMKTIINFTFG